MTLARRFRAYTLAAGARRDRVMFTLALVVALGLILAIFTWPGRFPTITVAPLILLPPGCTSPTATSSPSTSSSRLGMSIVQPRVCPPPGPTKIVMLSRDQARSW